MIALADRHIGRVTLRGSATAVAHARATLPPALVRARWPDGEAVLVVRRITVGGTGTELAARAAAHAGQLADRAADPWARAADGAEVVRFRDLLDYRACLARDLLAGTAAGRWLWRHRAALLARPTAAALAELLGEDALALPALLGHPALRESLPALWCHLDAAAARSLLHAIATATGWHGVIADALGSRTAAPAGGDAELVRESEPPIRRGPGDERRREAPAPRLPAEPATTRADSARPVAPSGAAARGKLPANDPRIVLEAVLDVWRSAPALLAGPRARDILRTKAEAIAGIGGGQGPGTPAAREAGAARPRAAGRDLSAAAQPQDDGLRSTPSRSTASERSTRRAAAGGLSPPRATDAEDERPAPAPRAGAPGELSGRTASTLETTQAEVDFHTGCGGLFFLLNVLNLPGLRVWRATLHEAHAGWRELARLALRLDLVPDAPLAGFLIEACTLDGELDPLARLGSLATLSSRADPAPVDQAVLRHVGDAALRALRTARAARVRADPSHVDVHLRLAEVDLELRRGGLDLDPGWLPWLGRVVRFHYDRSDAVDRGGPLP